MLPPLAIVAIGATALWLLHRRHGTVVAGGPPGTIVDVSPLTGVKHVQISAGQTVRVNLPKEWVILSAVGPAGEPINPASLPMQSVPSRHLGGIVFTAAMPGRETITFAKGGTTDTFDVTFDVSPMMGDHAAGAHHRMLPYREYWTRQRANPWWRWREEQWRLHRRWLPAWGPPPPPPADPVADVIDLDDSVTADV